MPRFNDRIGIYYEHPQWFAPLFAQLERQGTPFVRLNATEHHFDPASLNGEGRLALVVNRMSPSAWRRGHAQSIFYTHDYLAHLERHGTRVINGGRAFRYETSKALQLALLEELGLPYPKARVINHASQAPVAAEGLRFPIIVKPNIGGSGAGIRRFDTPRALAQAAAGNDIELGLDHTALVQEFAPARGGHIVRVEVLGGHFLYAIKVFLTGDTFNLCPADICQPGREPAAAACPAEVTRTSVEAFTPPPEAVAEVEHMVAEAGIDVGGVEYLVDDRDGQRLYYDINALSNFISEGERVVGFDPYAKLARWLADQAAEAAA